MTFHWATPDWLLKDITDEFGPVYDPCPLGSREDGLYGEWKSPTFLNPPYSRGQLGKWVKRAYQEGLRGNTVICLLPVWSHNDWWHEYVTQAKEVRWIRHKIKFKGAKYNAPFSSCLVIFDGNKARP